VLRRRAGHRHHHRAALIDGSTHPPAGDAERGHPRRLGTRRPIRGAASLAAFAAACATAWGGWHYLGPDGETASSRPGAEPAAGAAAERALGEAPESAVAPATAPQPESPALEPNAVVLDVVDGDTVNVDVSGVRVAVRFLGIDTPEKTGGFLPAECGGDAATRRTAELLPAGTEVFLQRDVELYDRYDRLLAYVYRAADGLFVNRYLVLDGYAAALHYEPNTHHRAVLDAAQADARAAGRGIWGDCGGPDRPLAGAG